MHESSAAAVSPVSASRSGGAPNLFTRILREWPDAVARAAIIAVAFALFWLTWAHWGSIEVDCGREVYVPYEILRGKLLYRDLWYPYGPLEPYVSALLLKLFGEHLSVLYFFGLAMAIGCALVLFDLGKLFEGRAVGLTAALALLLQGFQPSIFNYIFPYSYAATLGLLLALLCVLFTLRHVLDPGGRNLILAGLFAGLALLSKQEFGAACYLILTLVLLAETTLRRSVRTLARDVIACVPGFALAVAVYGCFFWKVTPRVILYANWQYTPQSYFSRTYAAAESAAIGLRFIPIEMFLLIVDAVLATFLWCWIAKFAAARVRRVWWCFVTIALLAIGLAAARQFAPLIMYIILAVLIYPRGMFFIGCAFFVYTLYWLIKQPDNRRLLDETIVAVFALTLAIRVYAQITPAAYSIFYDLPLVLVFIIGVARCIDLYGRPLAAGQRRGLLNSLLAMEVIMLAIVVIPGRGSERTARLETSWGSMYLRPVERNVIRQISDFILEQKQRGRRVALLPELPMLYAFTGTEAPSRWYTTIAGYLSPAQEEGYIVDLKRGNPDYIVLTNRSTPEANAPYFGIDYDRKIYRWIQANYRVTGQFGQFSRHGNPQLAALLYQRRASSNEP